MVELWFYSGRIGNCMFAYAFNRCIADTLKLQCQLPKGTEILGFPKIAADAIEAETHTDKYTIYKEYKENPKTIIHENDNMAWFIEPQFQGRNPETYKDAFTIQQVLSTPNIENKWIVTLGNFETGEQYLPYRDKLKEWFEFPELDISKFEFFKLHSDLGNNNNFYQNTDFPGIHENDLFISLRLEEYTNPEYLDRFLKYDYFKIILGDRKWNNIYIMSNPGSLGNCDKYQFTKEFYPFDPIFIRCYDPVMSMALGAKFNNIAISQSTYSWWIAFLSNAKNIFYPISKEGPFSLEDKRYQNVDLRVSSPSFKYVDQANRVILPDDYYTKIDYKNRSWLKENIIEFKGDSNNKLEVHTLICKRDINEFIKTIKLFSHHSKLDFDIVVHEDGSFDEEDYNYLQNSLSNINIIRRKQADEEIKEFLKNHELCTHFRFAEHHTIFRIKLFDPFYFTKSHNVLYLDADILFCKYPQALIKHIQNKEGAYLRDTWSSYCVPFRDEDNDTSIDRFINAGLNYYPTSNHYSLDEIEKCLEILYNHGSRGATHPFLEQNCIAYMITQLRKNNISFHQLPYPEYCVPTFNKFVADHGLTALHLNSSPLVGQWKKEHYEHELKKANIN